MCSNVDTISHKQTNTSTKKHERIDNNNPTYFHKINFFSNKNENERNLFNVFSQIEWILELDPINGNEHHIFR